MSFFVCPKCGCTDLRENEIGAVITREVRGIHPQYHHTIYDVYWISAAPKKWWTCGECGWHVPADTVDELIIWLDEKREERKAANGQQA